MAEDDGKKPPAKDGNDDGMNTDAGKKALQTERDRVKALEAQVKELKPLADQAKKLEDEKLGETERLTKQINDLTKDRDAATARAERYEVALEKGLNLTRAKRLVGATRDELAADADELLADLGDNAGNGKKPAADRKPTENLRGGGDPDEGTPVDVRKVVDSIPRGF